MKNAHTQRKGHVNIQRDDSHLPGDTDALIWNFQPLELGEKKRLLFKPIRGVLLRQPRRRPFPSRNSVLPQFHDSPLL